MEEKHYSIGGREYVQRRIVLGQLQLLLPLIGSVEITQGTVPELIGLIGEGLPRAMAVVLLEEGSGVREACKPEALQDRTEALQWDMTPEIAVEVAEDFFECNRASSLFEKISSKLQSLVIPTEDPSISSPSSTPPARETSRDESTPSG